MSDTVQELELYGWFLVDDKWHRTLTIHYIEKNSSKSSCGQLVLSPESKRNIVYFDTIDNITVRSICKFCLRKNL